MRRIAIAAFFLAVVWLVCLLPVAATLHWLFDLNWPYLLLPASFFLTVVYAFGSLQVLRNGPDWLAFLSMQFLGICSVGWLTIIAGLLVEIAIPGLNPLPMVTVAWLTLIAVGLYNALRLTVSSHTVSDYRIKNPIRVVHITDVHIGSRRAGFLERVVNTILHLEPDIVVITGDLIDLSRVEAINLQALAKLPCQVLMCTGNHERYIDMKKALAATESQGVTVLRDESVEFADIRFIGIDDREDTGALDSVLQSVLAKQARRINTKEQTNTPVANALDNKDLKEPYTIVLYHKPDGWQYIKQKQLPLMLAGHTHNGQVWPFQLLVKRRYPEIFGWYVDDKSAIYVSSGTGTWGPVMRLGSRNEINVFDLKPGSAENEISASA